MKKNKLDQNRNFPIRSQLLLYSMNGKHATAVGIVYELDEDIDSKCMESAYLTAMKRFPYFNVKPKLENGSLYREWVEEPLPLQHDTEDYLINEADNLGYLYRVSVNGRKLSVQFFHGLADGAGIQNLVKLMLSLYYAQKGEAVSGVKDLFDLNEPVAYSEYMDPLDLEVFKGMEGMPFNQGEFFRLPEKNEKNLVTHSFSCDGESLMKYVKSIDGTPNVITAVLLSECIAKMYPESANKKIRSAIAINGKNFFGPERNHTPFLSVSFFDFDEKRLHMNRETLHTCVRGTIFKDCFGDILISKFAGGKKLGEMFSMMPSPEAKKQLADSINDAPVSTFSVSYAGPCNMGSMEKHIRNVYSFADNTTPVMEINYANGKFFFCIAARFDGRKYMEAFAKALNGQGIKTTEIKTVSFQEGAESADFPEANRKNEEENRHD